MLRWLGHPAVALLDGGFAAWQATGLPISVVIPQPSPAHFEVQLQSEDDVSTALVRQGIEKGTLTVVDARTAARYAGEVEPIDPVAGHIPTALNYPYEANLNARGRFLSAELLRTRFMTLAAHPEQVVHMCGSGVTACHNLLAMEIAGLTGSKLYAGSWSEWVRDPRNPITKGCQA
jgi:thiosulfate/3-mercaptopyruvate sulfurtransferase